MNAVTSVACNLIRGSYHSSSNFSNDLSVVGLLDDYRDAYSLDRSLGQMTMTIRHRSSGRAPKSESTRDFLASLGAEISSVSDPKVNVVRIDRTVVTSMPRGQLTRW